MPAQAPETAKTMSKKTWWLVLAVGGLVAVAFWLPSAIPEDDGLPIDRVEVVARFPHDPTAFTQGLAVEGEVIYEGTGHYGESTLRKLALSSGKTLLSRTLGPDYFGEGVTVMGNWIYQLTWKEGYCIVYDKETLRPLGSHRYAGEGWGLADDGQKLYMSDGSSVIRIVDPQTFKTTGRLRVRQGRRSVDKLNELEFVNGELWANIWYSDHIARIDPSTGDVVGWIDCSEVYPARSRPDREHVLNGIAYDAATGRLFITGKNWPQLYEIQIKK